MAHETWRLVEIDLAGDPVVEIWVRGTEMAVRRAEWPAEGPEDAEVDVSRPPSGG